MESKFTSENFTKEFQEYLHERKFSNAYLAKLLGIDWDTVSRMKNLPNTILPDWIRVMAILLADGISLDEISREVRPVFDTANLTKPTQSSTRGNGNRQSDKRKSTDAELPIPAAVFKAAKRQLQTQEVLEML